MMRETRTRPPVLRALGSLRAPRQIAVDGEVFERVEEFKHDSWAATARYRGPDFDLVCKFNRSRSIFGIPAGWLGRWLARREMAAYRDLADVAGIPTGVGQISADGRSVHNVSAHRYIPGSPLRLQHLVDDQFFPRLLQIVQRMHEAGYAYVDLHKRENILVGEDGRPHLFDFQISLSRRLAKRLGPFGIGERILGIFQQADLFCLAKHVRRVRPDQLESLGLGDGLTPPFWIRAHRLVAVPFRQTRRRLLAMIGVRDSTGAASSERQPETGLRAQS